MSTESELSYQYVDYIRCEGEPLDAYLDAENATLILREGLTFEECREARLRAESDYARYKARQCQRFAF